MHDDLLLDLASTLHYVAAGLDLLIFAGVAVMLAYVPGMYEGVGVAERGVIQLVVGIVLFPSFVMHILSGVFLRQRKNRLFCIVHAALQCLSIPFGLALGVFTIVILNRENVQLLFNGERNI